MAFTRVSRTPSLITQKLVEAWTVNPIQGIEERLLNINFYKVRTDINIHMEQDITDYKNCREIYFFRSVLCLSGKLDRLKEKQLLNIIPSLKL